MSFQFNRRLLALALAVPSLGSANSDNNEQAASGQPIEQLVVTAGRFEQQVSEVLAPLSVISRAEIERWQITEMGELLQRVPGLQVNQSGGLGGTTTLSIRGSETDHALILVDGVRINSATTGLTVLEYLDPGQIERIEIVRGPRSAQYGADAMGGVVNIITRRSGGGVQYRVGSHGEQVSAAQVSTSGALGDFYAAARHQTTDGIDHLLDDNAGNADDDAYRNSTLQLGYRKALTDGWQLGLQAQQNRGSAEYDSAWGGQPFSVFEITKANLDLSGDISETWLTQLQLAYSEDDSTYDDDTFSWPFNLVTERDSASWQNRIAAGELGTVVAGVDYYRDQVSSNPATGYDEDTVRNLGVFAQQQWQSGTHSVQWGLRSDDHSGYGQHTTGNIAYGYAFSDALELIASAGTGFKAPTFNDLYYPASPWYQGNPDLKPEESENIELSLRGQAGELGWRASLFNADYDNLIVDAYTADFVTTRANVASASVRGLELEAQGELAGLRWDANYTYLDAEDGTTGDDLLERSRHNATLDIERLLAGVNFGVLLKARSERVSDPFQRVTLPGVATMDLRASYALREDVTLSAKLRNALDNNYQSQAGYHADSRNWQLGVSWKL
ncbi:TonB-dependent receptor domain-containing protein [Biformimicrobium ophioploci]|uniref:TonB-dependent vitamin B12 receptor n=1 Tax=Biformimicrobium ophioploci TaxID=3036711 RepID=A0ABQ6M148_9GAMM|nr:TonB-dependent receptor [Microbulbifer sp. NKW57]GMG88021.1 TonB-dependent vitamin B12 receptor [Microbulbifer sp. NKW57]